MSDDTTNQNPNANSPSTMKQDWTKAKQSQAYEASKLPQASQENIAMVEDIYQKRLNEEQNKQSGARRFRERGEKIKLLENYVRDNAPSPNDPQARENDLKIIDQEAKRIVADREAYYLNRIEQERSDMINDVLKKEQQKQHDQEHDHGGQSPEQTLPEPEQER